MRFIPKEVNLLPEIKTYAYIERSMKDALRKGLFGIVYGRLKTKWQYKRTGTSTGTGTGPEKLTLTSPFPSKKLYLIGYGGDEPLIRQRISEPYLAVADALVFPSNREGFPRVVLEAGAMGLPSIVTDINGCNEIIVEGENGVIIPPRDKNSLYEAMLHFIDNPDKTTTMAANARRMVQERYEHQDVVEALLEMYNELE